MIYIQSPSSGSTAGIRVMCCTNTHTHTHTHIHIHIHILAVTWDRLRHIMQLPVLREAYFKLYSCIRMERFLPTVITNALLPPKVTFIFLFFSFNFFDVKNCYYILTRGEQIFVIKLSIFFCHSKGLTERGAHLHHSV
jgi:hypothetical protein